MIDAEVEIKTKQETSNEEIGKKKSRAWGQEGVKEPHLNTLWGRGDAVSPFLEASNSCSVTDYSWQLDLLCNRCVFCLASAFTFSSYFPLPGRSRSSRSHAWEASPVRPPSVRAWGQHGGCRWQPCVSRGGKLTGLSRYSRKVLA